MGLSWNDRRLERRVKPGDGKPLKPFRWWQMTRRSLLSIALPVGGRGGLSATYTVEVKHGGDPESGVVRARLYRDGLCEAESSSRPASRSPAGRSRSAGAKSACAAATSSRTTAGDAARPRPALG